MTLRELFENCQELIDSGFGNCEVIKATDGEGNDFISVGSLQSDKATGGPYRFEIQAEEALEYFDEEDLEGIQDVVTIW
jgi:hypothetical protein